jgi:3-oxoacyl-[acyl-carrier-protein] synthase-1
MKSNSYLIDLGIINALGSGRETVSTGILAGSRAGLSRETTDKGDFTIARAAPAVHLDLSPRWDNRLNRLLAVAAGQIRPTVERLAARFGAERIGVVLGSTDNGSEQSLEALRAFRETGAFPPGYEFFKQTAHHSSAFLREYLGLRGFFCNISTACTSSARALVLARSLLETGVCDAVVAGGADIVSRAVLNGFHALEAVDREPCNPFSRNRRGINLGEGAALFVVANDPSAGPALRLCGCGESSDAHHATAPDPEGRGAEAAMRTALVDAGLAAEDIDYINLHGTGTDLNDRMESKATARVFPSAPPASSGKAMIGHTLGAAGAMELACCWLAMQPAGDEYVLPPHLWDGICEEGLPCLNLIEPGSRTARLDHCMSNSYAFGGSNVSLILSRGASLL